MKKETKSLVDIFFEILTKKDTSNFDKCDSHTVYQTYAVYENLFQLIDRNTLEYMLGVAYKHRKTDYWFSEFHKHIRQCGVYNNYYQLNPAPTIEKKEQQELNKLNKELDLANKKLDKFEKKLWGTVPPTTDPTYVQKQAEFDVKYKLMCRELWPQDKRSRRKALLNKLHEEEKKPINGKLDSILWSIIHVDNVVNKCVFSIVMERMFNEYDFLKKQNKKKH